MHDLSKVLHRFYNIVCAVIIVPVLLNVSILMTRKLIEQAEKTNGSIWKKTVSQLKTNCNDNISFKGSRQSKVDKNSKGFSI